MNSNEKLANLAGKSYIIFLNLYKVIISLYCAWYIIMDFAENMSSMASVFVVFACYVEFSYDDFVNRMVQNNGGGHDAILVIHYRPIVGH